MHWLTAGLHSSLQKTHKYALTTDLGNTSFWDPTQTQKIRLSADICSPLSSNLAQTDENGVKRACQQFPISRLPASKQSHDIILMTLLTNAAHLLKGCSTISCLNSDRSSIVILGPSSQNERFLLSIYFIHECFGKNNSPTLSSVGWGLEGGGGGGNEPFSKWFIAPWGVGDQKQSPIHLFLKYPKQNNKTWWKKKKKKWRHAHRGK